MAHKPIDFKINENGCYICTSHHKDKDGYPKKKWDGSSKAMSRFVYIQMFGEIPGDLVVRHKCDNRSCINPEHLELGTPGENNQDRDERGRTSKGVNHYQAKLNENVVKAIKFLLDKGVTPTDISNDLGIERDAVYNIKYNKTWKHVVL